MKYINFSISYGIMTLESAYSQSNNNNKVNWIAQELFVDVISDEMIAEIFNKE